MGRIAGRFARVEPRLRTRRLVLSLLSDLPRKNCWTIAEWAGETSPYGIQHLLCRAVWDADGVRDDVREYVVEHLHDDAAVLMVDETGDVKKGTHTVGVQRQYTGTAGRRDGSRTPRLRSTSSMPANAVTRRWTGSCTSRAPGRATRTAAVRPDSPRTPSSRPSRNSPAR
ncbi:transposase [Streptomyces sp. PB17]|uniref:transposase n=1 Tax=Streptomyces sp. PB17 TaxID=3384158 RepID=UPI0038B6311D